MDVFHMTQIELRKNERIVAVVPESCTGSGWSNRVVWVYIRGDMGGFRAECLQPDDQTPEMRTLFDSAAIMHRALVGAVPVVVAADELQAVNAALRAGQEPLGEEFEAAWDANREKLYEP